MHLRSIHCRKRRVWGADGSGYDIWRFIRMSLQLDDGLALVDVQAWTRSVPVKQKDPSEV